MPIVYTGYRLCQYKNLHFTHIYFALALCNLWAYTYDMLDIAKLKTKRESIGLSPGEMADKAGLSRMGYYKIETGRQSNICLDTMDRLARALGVGPCYLLKWR
jgi:DNA-binding XRE family transcriptional regulator